MIKPGSLLWQYLSPNQRILASDGIFLLDDSYVHEKREPSDFSYIVFPFAKLFEGFLKQIFLDLEIITKREYTSDHYRIGKALSPNLARVLKYSAYRAIAQQFGEDLAVKLWQTWKEGRNLVFHYFPHNYRSLTREQAEILIRKIVNTMDEAVKKTHVRPHKEEDWEKINIGTSSYTDDRDLD